MAGELISAIVPGIKKTADLVQEISTASREQSSGIEQIQKAMMQLDSVVQQNASASEEMASMAETLAGQAHGLRQTVSFFKLEESDGSSASQHETPEARALPGPNSSVPHYAYSAARKPIPEVREPSEAARSKNRLRRPERR